MKCLSLPSDETVTLPEVRAMSKLCGPSKTVSQRFPATWRRTGQQLRDWRQGTNRFAGLRGPLGTMWFACMMLSLERER